MKKLNYSSRTMEEFAIRVIYLSYDIKYKDFIWHDKDDNFDFTNIDNKIALEVATIIPHNVENVIKYEDALSKGKNPKIEKVAMARLDNDGYLLSYHGGSMSECRKLILDAIKKKESKIHKRKIKYDKYELCLCVNEGALFNETRDFNFLYHSNILNNIIFSKIFIITCSNFYVIEDFKIRSYNRLKD